MDNPYQSPEIESTAASGITLYSPGQIAWAAFLGTPIAGCFLLAMNYRRLGNFSAARTSLNVGLISTALLFVIGYFLPDNFPSTVVPAVYTIVVFQSVKSLQRNDFERLLVTGGKKASGWVATGIGILFLIVVLLAIFSFALLAPDEWFADE